MKNNINSIRAAITLLLLPMLIAAGVNNIIATAEENYIYKVDLYTYKNGVLARYNTLILTFYPEKGELRVSGGLIKPNLDERDAIIKVFNLKPTGPTSKDSHIYTVEGIGTPYICDDVARSEIANRNINGDLMFLTINGAIIPVTFKGEITIGDAIIYLELTLTAASKPVCGRPISEEPLKYTIGMLALILTIAALYTFTFWRRTLLNRWRLTFYEY